MLRHGASVRAVRRRGPTSSACATATATSLVYPLFHTAGLKSGLLASLLTGATLLPHLVFDPPTVMAHGAGGAGHDAPGTAGHLPDHPQRRHLASTTSRRCAWRSPAPRSSRSSWWCSMREELGFDSVVTGYGLTETTGIVDHVPPRRRPRDHRPHSGRPIPGIEMKIVDADGNEVPDRRAG